MDHTPANLPDGTQMKFALQPVTRPTSIPISTLFFLCANCGVLYLDPDERRNLGLKKNQALGLCSQ